MSYQPDTEWLCQQIAKLTTRVEILQPSEWTEAKRYLPASISAMPGYYRFDATPYWREVIDCLGPESPVRHVTIKKGVQVGATTLLENVIGYFIDHVKTAAMMLVTADSELAKNRIDSFIIPMLEYSGLNGLIRSADEHNPRKTGRTYQKIEFEGGGFLLPIGAQNADKLRSIPVQVLLRDEIDAWPDSVGKDGDPVVLSADRTAAYEASRKILDISTPLIRGASKIDRLFDAGDRRRYFVHCLGCGHAQTLRFRRTNKETGEITGFHWETEQGRLVPGSTRYRCEQCGHDHRDEDKPALFAAGEWRPTATPETPHHRSYHLSALYSPLGMQSWDSCALKWLEAWDEEHARSKSNAVLQTFYNNVLGESFEVQGTKLSFEIVSSHRRHVYQYGQIPNHWCEQWCGSRVLLVTCAVDVHIDNLAVAVFGWCRGRRCLLLNYWRFRGTTENLDDPNTWGRLRQLIESHEYVADDGCRYRVAFTLVDSGYLTDTVYRFCERYEAGVFPIKGRESAPKDSPSKEFWRSITPSGLSSWCAAVHMYKDRWSAALRRSWDGVSMQPEGFFNAPLDAEDAQLKELTVEVRREKIDKASGKRLGFEWFRPSGAANELWDTLIYANVALDIVAWDVCITQQLMPQVDWNYFWDQLAA